MILLQGVVRVVLLQRVVTLERDVRRWGVRAVMS